jgi:amidohydrolase
MPIINRIAEYHSDMKEWRQHIHAHPELMFDCHKTAAFVVERLREFGVDEIHEGIAESGLVAIINGQGDGPTIGLRADMDALPLQEIHDHDYKSTVDGKMHACGHDGHTTMLLGAAKYLAETRNFTGRVALIFQPAEEGGGGAEVMCDAGIMDNFKINQVYGVHNIPGPPLGQFLARKGPALAAADEFKINITGAGGHGAMPELTIDPVVVAVQIASAIQTISSRNVAANDNLVISITEIHTGTAGNIIPQTAFVGGTVRTLTKEVQVMVVRRMQEICDGMAAAFGANVEMDFQYGYPAMVNHDKETDFAVEVAKGIAGAENVETDVPAVMGAEDFAYMLEHRPGSYLFIGGGEGASLHHPEYNFNDDMSPIGASYFVKLVETAQPLNA